MNDGFSAMCVVYEGYIDGDFEGFDEGQIYKLDDGSYIVAA